MVTGVGLVDFGGIEPLEGYIGESREERSWEEEGKTRENKRREGLGFGISMEGEREGWMKVGLNGAEWG